MPRLAARPILAAAGLLALLCPATRAQGSPAADPAVPAPRAVELVDDLQYAEQIAKDARRNRLDLYLPTGVERPPLVVFVHGGAWMGGDKSQHRFVGRAVARAGLACAVVNYRLSPMVQHPAHTEDCARAVAFLHAEAGKHGYDPDRLFLMGHSAGGHIVALLTVDPTLLRTAGVPDGVVKGCIPLSGPMDVRPNHLLFEGVFGRDAEVRKAASPLLHGQGEQPPMLLFWAERDMAGLAEQNRLMAAHLRELGAPHQAKELKGESHVGYLFRIGAARDVILPPILTFVTARCAELDAAGEDGAKAKDRGETRPGVGR